MSSRLPNWRRQVRISIDKPSPQKLKAPPVRPAAGVLQMAHVFVSMRYFSQCTADNFIAYASKLGSKLPKKLTSAKQESLSHPRFVLPSHSASTWMAHVERLPWLAVAAGVRPSPSPYRPRAQHAPLLSPRRPAGPLRRRSAYEAMGSDRIPQAMLHGTLRGCCGRLCHPARPGDT